MTYYVVRPEAVLPTDLPPEPAGNIENHVWKVFKIPTTDLFSHLFTDFIVSHELAAALDKSRLTGLTFERVSMQFSEEQLSATAVIAGARLVINGVAFKDDFAIDGTELIVSQTAINLLRSYCLGKTEIVPITERELQVRRGLFKECSFCGALLEPSDIFTGPKASVCRICVLQLDQAARERPQGGSEQLPMCSFCMRQPSTAVAGHEGSSICAFHLDVFRKQVREVGIA